MTTDLEFERGLPAALDAERTLLGAILLDNQAWFEIADLLRPADFYNSSHRLIFGRMSLMMGDGTPVDLVTLCESMRDHGELDRLGGVSYLALLTEGLPRRLSCGEYVRLVREKSSLRRLIDVCSATIAKCADQSEDAAEIVRGAERQVCEISATGEKEPTTEELSAEAWEKLMRRRRGEETLTVPSGVSAIDSEYGGFAQGELTVIGGRPGQGKSSTLFQAIRANCRVGNPADLYTMEMRADSALYRLWSIESGVPFHKVRHPERLSETETRYVEEAKREAARWPLYVCDRKLDADELCAKVRLGKLRRGTKIAGVDYLQKMRMPAKADQRFLAVSAASSKLADLANDTGIAVVVLSSLTDVKGRNRNEAPTLQDLRNSGDIQYDAHYAYLIHRKVDDATEKLELGGQFILAKSRNDRQGALDVTYDDQHLIFM